MVQCDPARAAQDPTFHSNDLESFTDLDFVSIHTPLTRQGPHPTYHLIDKNF